MALNKKIKILHISTYDHGGAAIAAIRLHKALLEQDISSSILFLNKTKESLPNSFGYINILTRNQRFIWRQTYRIKNKLLNKFSRKYINKKKLRNKFNGFELFSFNPTDFDIAKQPVCQEADVIHLHWVAGFLDYSFFQKNTKPVIWTLHDMNPFTGGCHYSSGCEKYKTECKDCPQLQGTINSDNAFFDQEYKKSFLVGQAPVITAPSQWLWRSSTQSRLFGTFQNIYIPYSLDISVFKPQNKSFCRSVLNLPQEKKILLYVSVDIENKRKGFDLLLEALSGLDMTNVHICAVGVRDIKINYRTDIMFLGSISDERLMALVYSAADVFILPSREDNLPNVLLESVACGTPVISFPVGGMLDIIKTGLNGILAYDLTSASLAGVINEF
jgi:glycosyltransferase involved in cell wall biosynthesis